MSGILHFIVVALDDQRFALPLAAVDRVVRAVYVTSLPEAPSIVLGIVSVHGQIIPVLNLWERCGIRAHEIELEHQMVIARTARQTIAFVVDSSEVIACTADKLIPVDQIASGVESRKVVSHSQEMIPVYELDTLLSVDDELVLSGAIDAHQAVVEAS